jgi:hypothetical protein
MGRAWAGRWGDDEKEWKEGEEEEKREDLAAGSELEIFP